MTNQRVPVLTWGDIVKGRHAVNRRTLVGPRATECMFSWVYLTDIHALRRLHENLEGRSEFVPEAKSVLADFDQVIWTKLDRSQIDPHFQLKKDALRLATTLLSAVNAHKGPKELACTELGQTFFSLIDRYNLVRALTKRSLLSSKTVEHWIGIDISEFLNRTAISLHPENDNITIYDDWKKFKRFEDFEHIYLSRFVTTYAFESAGQFADFFTDHFSAGIIEDAYSTIDKDIRVENNGIPQVFFNLRKLQKTLSDRGYDVFLLDFHGDYPALTAPCLVTKLLILKRGLFNIQAINQTLSYHGFDELDSNQPADFVNYMNSQIQPSDWKKIKKVKSVRPIWERVSTKRMSFKERLKATARPWWYKWQIWKNGLGRHNFNGRHMDESLIIYLNETQKR